MRNKILGILSLGWVIVGVSFLGLSEGQAAMTNEAPEIRAAHEEQARLMRQIVEDRDALSFSRRSSGSGSDSEEAESKKEAKLKKIIEKAEELIDKLGAGKAREPVVVNAVFRMVRALAAVARIEVEELMSSKDHLAHIHPQHGKGTHKGAHTLGEGPKKTCRDLARRIIEATKDYLSPRGGGVEENSAGVTSMRVEKGSGKGQDLYLRLAQEEVDRLTDEYVRIAQDIYQNEDTIAAIYDQEDTADRVHVDSLVQVNLDCLEALLTKAKTPKRFLIDLQRDYKGTREYFNDFFLSKGITSLPTSEELEEIILQVTGRRPEEGGEEKKTEKVKITEEFKVDGGLHFLLTELGRHLNEGVLNAEEAYQTVRDEVNRLSKKSKTRKEKAEVLTYLREEKEKRGKELNEFIKAMETYEGANAYFRRYLPDFILEERKRIEKEDPSSSSLRSYDLKVKEIDPSIWKASLRHFLSLNEEEGVEKKEKKKKKKKAGGSRGAPYPTTALVSHLENYLTQEGSVELGREITKVKEKCSFLESHLQNEERGIKKLEEEIKALKSAKKRTPETIKQEEGKKRALARIQQEKSTQEEELKSERQLLEDKRNRSKKFHVMGDYINQLLGKGQDGFKAELAQNPHLSPEHLWNLLQVLSSFRESVEEYPFFLETLFAHPRAEQAGAFPVDTVKSFIREHIRKGEEDSLISFILGSAFQRHITLEEAKEWFNLAIGYYAHNPTLEGGNTTRDLLLCFEKNDSPLIRDWASRAISDLLVGLGKSDNPLIRDWANKQLETREIQRKAVETADERAREKLLVTALPSFPFPYTEEAVDSILKGLATMEPKDLKSLMDLSRRSTPPRWDIADKVLGHLLQRGDQNSKALEETFLSDMVREDNEEARDWVLRYISKRLKGPVEPLLQLRTIGKKCLKAAMTGGSKEAIETYLKADGDLFTIGDFKEYTKEAIRVHRLEIVEVVMRHIVTNRQDVMQVRDIFTECLAEALKRNDRPLMATLLREMKEITLPDVIQEALEKATRLGHTDIIKEFETSELGGKFCMPGRIVPRELEKELSPAQAVDELLTPYLEMSEVTLERFSKGLERNWSAKALGYVMNSILCRYPGKIGYQYYEFIKIVLNHRNAGKGKNISVEKIRKLIETLIEQEDVRSIRLILDSRASENFTREDLKKWMDEAQRQNKTQAFAAFREWNKDQAEKEGQRLRDDLQREEEASIPPALAVEERVSAEEVAEEVLQASKWRMWSDDPNSLSPDTERKIQTLFTQAICEGDIQNLVQELKKQSWTPEEYSLALHIAIHMRERLGQHYVPLLEEALAVPIIKNTLTDENYFSSHLNSALATTDDERGIKVLLKFAHENNICVSYYQEILRMIKRPKCVKALLDHIYSYVPRELDETLPGHSASMFSGLVECALSDGHTPTLKVILDHELAQSRRFEEDQKYLSFGGPLGVRGAIAKGHKEALRIFMNSEMGKKFLLGKNADKWLIAVRDCIEDVLDRRPMARDLLPMLVEYPYEQDLTSYGCSHTPDRLLGICFNEAITSNQPDVLEIVLSSPHVRLEMLDFIEKGALLKDKSRMVSLMEKRRSELSKQRHQKALEVSREPPLPASRSILPAAARAASGDAQSSPVGSDSEEDLRRIRYRGIISIFEKALDDKNPIIKITSLLQDSLESNPLSQAEMKDILDLFIANRHRLGEEHYNELFNSLYGFLSLSTFDDIEDLRDIIKNKPTYHEPENSSTLGRERRSSAAPGALGAAPDDLSSPEKSMSEEKERGEQKSKKGSRGVPGAEELTHTPSPLGTPQLSLVEARKELEEVTNLLAEHNEVEERKKAALRGLMTKHQEDQIEYQKAKATLEGSLEEKPVKDQKLFALDFEYEIDKEKSQKEIDRNRSNLHSHKKESPKYQKKKKRLEKLIAEYEASVAPTLPTSKGIPTPLTLGAPSGDAHASYVGSDSEEDLRRDQYRGTLSSLEKALDDQNPRRTILSLLQNLLLSDSLNQAEMKGILDFFIINRDRLGEEHYNELFDSLEGVLNLSRFDDVEVLRNIIKNRPAYYESVKRSPLVEGAASSEAEGRGARASLFMSEEDFLSIAKPYIVKW